LLRQAVQGAEPPIRFTPENHKTIYLNWMENLYDWCISRQLWWGHRIPAWVLRNRKCVHSREYAGGEPIVDRSAPEKCPACAARSSSRSPTCSIHGFFRAAAVHRLGMAIERRQDAEELAYFYPTSLLITGQDILFFWVARMIMMGSWFMRKEPKADGSKRELKDAVPFREVYIHALVRDAERQKMSKTKGNVLDPIEVIEKYGTDATALYARRNGLAWHRYRLQRSPYEGYRAFANKIWNAARFVFMNVDRAREAGWCHRKSGCALATAPRPHSKTAGFFHAGGASSAS